MATPEEGPVGLLLKLVAALEGIIVGVGPMVEGEAHMLFTLAATLIFSHLHLRDPSFDLGVLLEPVAPELHDDAAKAVRKQVVALLQKFLYIDPATVAGGKDGGDIVDDGPPRASDGGVQGRRRGSKAALPAILTLQHLPCLMEA